MGRTRVALLDDYQGVALGLADWDVHADRLDPFALREPLAGPDAVVDALAGVEVVVAMRERTPFPRAVLERLPDLRLLVTTGMRNASIDLAAARDLGVTVCGTGGSSYDAAELTWALVMAASKRLDTELGNVRAGRWMSTLGFSLAGRTLGVLGLGRLGGRVATYARAFDMPVLAWSENLTDERCAEVGATRAASLDELLEGSDVVSVHLQLSERTRGLVGAAQLARMRPDAWLVNTSRGPICDEDALVAACREGTIAGAALDVFGTEPLPAEHPFRTLPNVLATPHVGYVTEDVYRRWYAEALEDVLAFLDDAPLRVLT